MDLTPPTRLVAAPPVPAPAAPERQPESELPQSVCPQGVVDSALAEAENLPEPSPLDEHFPTVESAEEAPMDEALIDGTSCD